MGSHEGVGGLQRDGISNVCDLAHIWSHPLRKGEWEGVGGYISSQNTHTRMLINPVLLAAAGPDSAPAETDVGGSSTRVDAR